MPCFYSHLSLRGAGVVRWLCNGLPRNDPGFDSRWGRCKIGVKTTRGSIPDGDGKKTELHVFRKGQWGAVSIWDVKHNPPNHH